MLNLFGVLGCHSDKFLAVLIRPECSWLDEGIVPAAILLVFAVKVRHGWPYLKVLHSESRGTDNYLSVSVSVSMEFVADFMKRYVVSRS